MKLHLLVLQGGGDRIVTLIGEATFAWINSPWPVFEEGAATEHLSLEVKQEMLMLGADADDLAEREADGCSVTTGSCENDRALWVLGTFFDGKTEAKAWAKAQGHTLGETWEGYIY